MSLGARIRAAREAAGLTQGALGSKLGKTKTAVSYWESDLYRPDIDDRVDLARLLSIPFSELLPEAEQQDGEVVTLTDPSIRQIVKLWPLITQQWREGLLMLVAKLGVPDSPPADAAPPTALERRKVS